MRTLILLRHGEAEARAASGRDLDRALTEAGRRDAALAGARIAAAGLAPALALVSPAARTRETWAAAAAAAGGDSIPAQVLDALYDAPADALLEAASAGGAPVVVLVAHNPGLGELAARLAGEPAPFPPAALAAFDLDGDAPRLRLRWAPPGAPQGALR